MPGTGLGDHGLKVRISGLSNGLHDYSFETEPAALDLDGSFPAPVRVKAQLDKTTRQMLLRAEIETTGRFQCDRCLEEFEKGLTAAYAMVYVYAEEDAATAAPEEVRLIAADTTVIDLGQDIREMIMLSVPLKLLCTEECRGLCPRCGRNLNAGPCGCADEAADPRWDALKNLLNR